MNVGTVTGENTYNQSGGSTVNLYTLNIGVSSSSSFNNYNISGSGRNYCQKSWMSAESQAASLVPSLKITPAITAGSNVLPLSFRQWF